MKRREFIADVGGAAAWPMTSRAQQDRIRTLGVLMTGAMTNPDTQVRVAVLRDGLKKLGWTEGRNLRLEVRGPAISVDAANAAVAELLKLAPDVILTGTENGLTALRRETSTIPIIFFNLPDPVALGLVPTIASSGSNITGFTAYEFSTAGKWFAILHELNPRMKNAGFILATPDREGEGFFRSFAVAATASSVEPTPIRVADVADFEPAIAQFAAKPDGGLACQPTTITLRERATIISLAARHRLPAIYPFRENALDGGLAFYGIDFLDLYRGAASYADRILRGAKPADLPIQAPTRFDLLINLKTAKALNIEIPPSLLARADEVIE
jgi:putative ABC transport system substrate-binding protein